MLGCKWKSGLNLNSKQSRFSANFGIGEVNYAFITFSNGFMLLAYLKWLTVRSFSRSTLRRVVVGLCARALQSHEWEREHQRKISELAHAKTGGASWRQCYFFWDRTIGSCTHWTNQLSRIVYGNKRIKITLQSQAEKSNVTYILQSNNYNDRPGWRGILSSSGVKKLRSGNTTPKVLESKRVWLWEYRLSNKLEK